MGKRGPKPRPTTLKELHGTVRTPDRRRGPDALAPGVIGEPPGHLTDAQKGRWVQAVRDAPANILRCIDGEILADFVIASEIAEQAIIAQRKLDEGANFPMLVKGDKHVIVVSPYYRLLFKAMEAKRGSRPPGLLTLGPRRSAA